MDHTISLAIADRCRSLAFYRDGLALEAFGPVADDGAPEPLQFRLGSVTSLMLIPIGGFGWVVGEARVSPSGTNECVLCIYVPNEVAVQERYAAALPLVEPACTNQQSRTGTHMRLRSKTPTGIYG
jgi:uncharacterized protein